MKLESLQIEFASSYPQQLKTCSNKTLKLADKICIFLSTAVKDLLKNIFEGTRQNLYLPICIDLLEKIES